MLSFCGCIFLVRYVIVIVGMLFSIIFSNVCVVSNLC